MERTEARALEGCAKVYREKATAELLGLSVECP
jgi:hypothetical protein